MEETSKKTTAMSFTGASATQLCTNESLRKPGTLKGEEVESAKAEMSQVREENTRLKMMLQKIENEYKTLKMLVEDKPENTTGGGCGNNEVMSSVEEPEPEHELISLCLGTNRNVSKNKEENIGENMKKKNGSIGLKLGLDNYDEKSKYEVGFSNLKSSHDNGLLSAGNKEEDGGEKCVSNKGLKTIRNGDEDEVSQVNNVKRTRVSVRARCSTPTMNDGCQWRKYGQKIAKSNPCPRAYYRCTVAASCPVRKQVQRCAEDMSILVTTYEGTHNHPLPLSATAMASTTAAAASMLLSGSSSSPPQGFEPTSATAGPNLTTTTFQGFNINMPNNNSNTHPFYMSNPSSSPPFPTITLDLTAPPSSSSSPFNMAGATNFQSNSSGLFPFTGFGFSNPYSNALGNLDYEATPFSNRTQQHIGSLFQSPMQKRPELMSAAASSQQVLTETLTRAITSDPNFRSVIAAAISKMNGGSGSSVHQANNTVESLGRNLKWDVDQEKSTVPIPSPAAHQAI